MKELLDLPDDFVELVRDALLHVYDATYLQTHPLLAAASGAATAGAPRSRLLRQALLDTLQPGMGVAAGSPAWRTYRLLELRYIKGHEVADVIEPFALRKSQYHQEHHRTLQVVASPSGSGGNWQGAGSPCPPASPRRRSSATISRGWRSSG